MRIEERIGAEAAASQPAAASDTRKIRGSAGPGVAGTEGGPSDSARLSTLAGRIRGRLETIGNEHAARVERLAAEVRSGRYRVDAEALGRALASEALGGAGL